MIKRFNAGMRIGVTGLLLCLPAIGLATADMRILIDVSGSMKQNDPANLRVPALKLLAEILPAGSRSGVWVFDGSSRMILPVQTINPKWSERVKEAAGKINSQGAYTNIEQALRSAIQGWKGAASDRSILLLTDGQIDISKNPADALASKARIIETLLPELQRLNARVYSVALSDNADSALMKQLSDATGGWFEITHDANELQRRFLQVFKQAVPHESVPLVKNEFHIDGQIKEFTAVVFLRAGAQPTHLSTPAGSRWGQNDAPEGSLWRHESGYDLVTVKDPAPGLWHLDADMDPDNQVIVVTDLKLEHAPLPTYLHQGDAINFAMHLTEKSELFNRQDFLKLVKTSAQTVQMQPPATTVDFPLTQDTKNTGNFIGSAPAPDAAGRYTIRFIADGGSFQRVQEQVIERLPDWVKSEIAPGEGTALTPVLSVKFTPHPDAMDASDWLIEAMVADQGSTAFAALTPRAEGVDRIVDVPMPAGIPGRTLALRVSGKSLMGQTFSAILPSITLTPDMLLIKPPQPVSETALPSPQESAAIVQPESVPAAAPAEEQLIIWPEPSAFRLELVLFLLLNLVGAGGFYLWRGHRKKEAKKMLYNLKRKLT